MSNRSTGTTPITGSPGTTGSPANTAPGESAPAGARPSSHDRALLAHVRPADWVNPTAARRYDLVVVGAGTAGLVAAAGGAGLGLRVALVERRRLGGDCLNFGCVPSKAIIRAARSWQAARESAARFGGPAVSGDGDFAAAMERMRSLRADIAAHDGAARFRDLGIDVFLGDGRFTGAGALELDGQRLRFRRALIATGARPAVPPIPGLADSGYRTNETIFDLQDLPPSLAIVGAGPIGAELAQTFSRFGSRVILLDMAPHVLPREDADAAAVVERRMAREGVDLRLGVALEEVERRGDRRVIRFRQGEESYRVDAHEVLVTTGRAPNVEDLSLETAGVRTSRRGVEVDERLRTSSRRIYAAGDVASRYQFTHTADAQARIVLQNAFFLGRRKHDALVVPWVTYTSPEVAHVGLSTAEAAERGLEVESLTVPLSEVDRARLDGEEEGFLRLHLEPGSDRILGATLVAENAGDMISEITLAMTAGVGLGAIAAVIHPYPTQAEVIKRAADTWRRGKLTSTVQAALRWWLRAFRLFN